MHIEIKIIALGKLWMAATTLGGIQVRGRSAIEKSDAVRNLLWKLAGRDDDDDAKVALELELEGIDLTALPTQPQLGDGAAG